jgi:hypothetical protein
VVSGRKDVIEKRRERERSVPGSTYCQPANCVGGKCCLTIDPPPILHILHPFEDLPTLARTSFLVSLLSGLADLGELFRSTGGDDDVGAGFGEEDRCGSRFKIEHDYLGIRVTS